jgi:hypothetical protein
MRRVGYSLEPFDPKSALAQSEALASSAGAEAKVEAYRPLAYANPFNMWVPYPDLAAIDRSVRIFGLFMFQDPIDTNTEYLTLGYDSAYPFADASLSWTGKALPVALGARLGDNLVYGSSGPPERQSSASLTATLPLPLFPSPRYASLGLGGTVFDRSDGEGGSPYAWAYSGWNATASAFALLFGRIPGAAASTARGIDIVGYYDLDLASLVYKAEGRVTASCDRVPLRLDIWGAWAPSPILRLDSTSSVFTADRRPAYVEYGSLVDSSSGLLVEGTIACRLADEAIHSSVLGLYLNRLLVDAGFRGAWFRDEALSSSFARISLDLAAAQGMAAAGLRAYGEVFARFSVSSPRDMLGWRLGILLDADSGTPVKRESPAERGYAD